MSPRPGRGDRVGLGIVAKVVLALSLAATVSLGAGLLAGLAFVQMGRGLEQTTTTHLPMLVGTAELVRAAYWQVSMGPDILLARTGLMRDELLREVARAAAERTAILRRLHGLAPDDQDLYKLGQRFSEFGAMLEEFTSLANTRLAVEQRILTLTMRLRHLATRIGEYRTTDPCGALWQRHAWQGVTELLASHGTRSAGEVARLRARFATSLTGMQHPTGCGRPPPGVAPTRIQTEMAELAGTQGLFALREQALALRYALEDQLSRSHFLADALLEAVDEQFQAVQRQASEHGAALRRLATSRIIALVLGSALLLATIAGTYLYLGRTLLSPILQLNRAIETSTRGGAACFPAAGHDEVGLLVHAVRDFIGALRGREAELSRARQEAERANRHKSEFLAHISHELRAPLGIILGYADLLHRAPEQGESARQQLGLIRASALHLRQLIDDLLDVAAIEAGRLRPQSEDTDLARLLAEVVQMMAASAATRGLAFHSRLDPGLPARVFTDGRRLRQILLNLLGNAVKYTDTGSVTLVARAVGGGSRPRLRFLVADTGTGIAPADRSRLFEAFQQLRPGQPGSGLGLAISRELVRLLGGRLRLHSRPGTGSCFGFSITVARLADGTADTEQPMLGYAGPRQRLLVVDDQFEQRALLRDLLAPLGFQVDLAADRAGALRCAAAMPPALVLMDLNLGADSGLAVTRTLRRLLAPARPPVIAVSALPPAPSDAGDSFEAHLLKPVTPTALLSAIGECLGLDWLAAPGPSLPPRLELDTLMELVQWQDWQQVSEWCDDLAAGQPEYSDFAGAVRARAAARRADALLDWLGNIRAGSL